MSFQVNFKQLIYTCDKMRACLSNVLRGLGTDMGLTVPHECSCAGSLVPSVVWNFQGVQGPVKGSPCEHCLGRTNAGHVE